MKSIYERLIKKHGFSPAQKIVISLVLGGEVLEIGSSIGYMTKEFLKKGCVVDVVESNRQDAKKVGNVARRVFSGSIEDREIQRQISSSYNTVVCADVLEHLMNPQRVLFFLKRKLKKGGQILISIPNIAFWDMRLELLKGRFEYKESGLLDKTHLRFYTYDGFLKLLHDRGFKIVKIYPAEGRIPFEYTLRKIPLLGQNLVKFLKPKVMGAFPNLTYYHYVVQAKI